MVEGAEGSAAPPEAEPENASRMSPAQPVGADNNANEHTELNRSSGPKKLVRCCGLLEFNVVARKADGRRRNL